jgi:hypothetical protein
LILLKSFSRAHGKRTLYIPLYLGLAAEEADVVAVEIAVEDIG